MSKRTVFTGNEVSVLLADRCVRSLPEAMVYLKCPCYEGEVKVLVMTDPVYPLIIGNNVFLSDTSKKTPITVEAESNIPVIKTLIFENSSLANVESRSESKQIICDQVGEVRSVLGNLISSNTNSESICENNSMTGTVISAVQTRAQVKDETKSIRPLKHTIIDALNVSPDEFSKLQKEDKTLSKYWKLAEICCDDEISKVQFKIKNDVLYREYRSGPHDDVIEQLIVPDCLRERVVLYAHETTLSGHMGTHATHKKLCTNFFIPGAMQWCKRNVLSCLKCQQGANRNVGGKAPLQSLPVIF